MFTFLTLIIEILLLSITKNQLGEASSEFVILMISIGVIAFIVDIIRDSRFDDVRLPLFVGFMLRIALLFWDVFGRDIYTLPNSGADSSMFYRESELFAITGKTTRGLFPETMGTLFRITGCSQLFGQFLIVMCSMSSILILVFILQELSIDKSTITRTVGIVALLPNYAILSSIFLRESIIYIFISIALFCFVKWLNQSREIYYILAFVSVFCASAYHSGSVSIVLGFIIVRFLYDKNNHRFRLSISSVVPALLGVLVFFYLYNNYSELLFSKFGDLDDISNLANTRDEGGSSYARYVGNTDTLENMLIYTFPRFVYFLFSPFPWQWRGISDIVAFFFSSSFYLYTVVLSVKKLILRNSKHPQLLLSLLILVLCTVFVFGWGVSNTGTATRHREKILILFALIYAICNDGERLSEVTIGTKRLL